MNYFELLTEKHYNQIDNGEDFTLNLGTYNSVLTGNVGERVMVNTTFTVETSILASSSSQITYTQLPTLAKFEFSGNWFNEGISAGATIDIIWNGGASSVSETVQSFNLGNLYTTKTNLATSGLADGSRTDFEIRVTSAPLNLIYKYGVNKVGTTTNDYSSQIDGNEQSYFGILTTSFQQLNSIGNYKSWDTSKLEVKFLSTSGYIHSYEVKHEFVIPYYNENQLQNILQNTPTTDLIGTNTLKYNFGVFLSETNFDSNRVYEYNSQIGNVGYYNENYNGLTNDYSIQNVSYTNTLSTGTLEVTDTTTVSFQVQYSSNFTAGQDSIIHISKLPTASEYTNKTDTFSDVFMIDNLLITEGAAASSSTIISNATVNINGSDPTLLDVSFDVNYSGSQREDLSEDDYFIISFQVKDTSLSLSNEVNLIVDSQQYSKDTDVYGLITNNVLRFGSSDKEINYATYKYTNFSGWDSDFIGCAFVFSTDATRGAAIKSMKFKVLADDGANSFELGNINFGITRYAQTDPNITTYKYQLLNYDGGNTYNITDTESFNRIKLSTTPIYGVPTQNWSGEVAFKVNWRDWIENQNVDLQFYDITEPNNNLNYKVSNYSGLNGYDIYGVIETVVGSDVGEDTNYRLYSDISDIFDFDDNNGNGYTGTVTVYDANSVVVNNLLTNEQCRIDIAFNHSMGTSPKFWGEIIIEEVNTPNQEWRLSTHKDWSNPLNPLNNDSNGGLVSMTVISNKVTLTCYTNRLNLQEGVEYNIYGRIGEI